MAWIAKFGVTTIGNPVELNDSINRKILDSTESRTLVSPIRVYIDTTSGDNVEIFYTTDGGTTFKKIRELQPGEFDVLDEFNSPKQVYIRPLTVQTGKYIYWSASVME